jgi:uncharacterized protein (TIGR02145 family)
MAENLNHQTASSWCYNDADSNCTKYGSLYTWVETMGKMPADCDTTMSCKMFETVQGICPDNWHVPTKLEWTVMFAALEDSSKTGRILKAKTGWEENRGGTDDVGFSALPAGIRSRDGEFVRAGYYAYFWSATEWVANATSSYYAYLSDYDEAEINYQNKFEAMPVRCVQDPVLQKEVAGNFIDSRDGREYITVKIGSQTWMAENLSYAAEGSLCYQGNPDNCEYYGRLYDWNTAMGSGSSRDVCPQKWHLPSREEWLKLYAAVGGSASAEKVLKSRTDWKNTDDGAPGTGTNDVGFDALPAGNASGGFFYNQGYQTFFWSSTEYISGEFAYYMTLDYGGEGGSLVAQYSDLLSGDKRVFFSVRCVKD